MGPETDVALGVVRISTMSGSVKVIAESRTDIETTGRARISRNGSETTVDGGSSGLTVRVPTGTDVVVGARSGRIGISGPLGSVAVVAGSGRVTVERATSVDVRAKSGRVAIGAVDGTCRVSAASGRVSIDQCGDANVTTRSGRVKITDSHGPVHAHCVSGRIDVGLSTAADIDAETVSGRINISLPIGTHPQVTGTSRTQIVPVPSPKPPWAPPFDCVVTARSVSGRVSVRFH